MNILSVHVPVPFLVGVGVDFLIFPWTCAYWSTIIHQEAINSMVGAGWGEVIAWWVVDGAYALAIVGLMGVTLTWVFLSLIIDYIKRNSFGR